MAEVEERPPPPPTSAASIASIPGIRQVVLLLGLAAAVAVGSAVALWSQDANYRVLYPGMDPSEMSAVAGVLETAGIDYRLDSRTGALSVAAAKMSEAEMLLAGQGLPQSRGVSLENLYEGSGYSTSQFMESRFYAHALENKLARTISNINAVKSAEISLALPKQSVFLRDRKEPSASVLVHLYPGRTLEAGQIKAIVHLVAASVADMQTSRVTLLDENGTLLSDTAESEGLGAAARQFEYQRRIEQAYADNIDAILAPILGVGHSLTKVVAELDFTDSEETTEFYDPAGQVIRSEQTKIQESTDATRAIGIPGALSNQPPTAASETESDDGSTSSTRDTVRNFELGKTISRKRPPQGSLQRLSVAVVLDYLPPVGGERNAQREPIQPERLLEIEELIKEAVGYDAARGDTLKLSNEQFHSEPAPPSIQEPPVWEQPWVLDIGKVLLAALVVLALVLWVLRPLVQGLLQSHRVQVAASVAPALEHIGADGELTQQFLGHGDPIQVAHSLADTDPRRIAQVVREWVAADE